jgi:hypothetical protein
MTTFKVKGKDIFIKDCSTKEHGVIFLGRFGHNVTSDELEVFEGTKVTDFPVGSVIYKCF